MAGKYRIVGRPFGYPMYAADLPHVYPYVPFSDQAHESYIYDAGDGDNPSIKLAYWRGVAKHCGFDPATFGVEAAA